MTDDLVARLLAAIQEHEDKANAALPDAKMFEPLGDGQTLADIHIEAHGPSSVLRMCQAHRKIIDQHLAAKAKPDELLAKRAHGTYVREAQAALAALHAVIVSLAEGYGIEVRS